MLLLVLVVAGTSFAASPTYQVIPTDPALIVASGVADASGPAGIAFVEYWVWNGGNGYYYYTYRIYNEDFSPYIKHLTISNPTGTEYFITGKSSGWDPTTNTPGLTPWNGSVHTTLPTLVDWVSSDPYSNIYPGYSSWGSVEGELFQFASTLPPASAGFTVRQGNLMTYAIGLIPSPGSMTAMGPRSAGYWKHQCGTKGKKKEAEQTIVNAFNYIAGGLSTVFVDFSALNSLAEGYEILKPQDSSDMQAKAERQLLALWLNVLTGKLQGDAEITFDGPDGTEITETPFNIIATVEAILTGTSTPEQIEYAKDMAEILDNL